MVRTGNQFRESEQENIRLRRLILQGISKISTQSYQTKRLGFALYAVEQANDPTVELTETERLQIAWEGINRATQYKTVPCRNPS